MSNTIKEGETFRKLEPDTANGGYSLRYLCDEIARFYQLMGDKRAWESGRIHAAKKGIAIVYFNFRPANEQESEQGASFFQTALMGFMRRCLMLNVDL